MLSSWLLSSILFVSQSTNANEPQFLELKNKLEGYGFTVNVAIPPEFNPPAQKVNRPRRTRKPYGVLNIASKSIWINPVVFELGIGRSTIIHEAIHAAQYCRGNGQLKTLDLDIEPIYQAQPFYRRYLQPQQQELEKEAYAVQTQENSFELAVSLLARHCQS